MILPPWFRQDLPEIPKIKKMQGLFRERSIATVCESARCPNMGQCWGRGVATFMILGDRCTRSCRFCAVTTGTPLPVNRDEPEGVAAMADHLGLRYVVITSVTRDDLPDQGAGQFARTVKALRAMNSFIKIELLIPDFSGQSGVLGEVAGAQPDVLGHNIEMPRRLFSRIRPQADYDRSLSVLREIRRRDPDMIVKSGFMVGLGETEAEVEDVMRDLRSAGCDLLTIGQYLSPSETPRHVPVDRFVEPAQFEYYRQAGMDMGFQHVFSAPLVRSSYIAEEAYRVCCQNRQGVHACCDG
jgi:lipoyl synthase